MEPENRSKESENQDSKIQNSNDSYDSTETQDSIETHEKVHSVVYDARGLKLLEDMFAKIPDQMAFKIGDVADLAEVKPYVLRYWEQEFDILRPKKAVNNQRIYSRRDVETALMIKKFLHIDKFSIPGAIRAIKLARKKQAQPEMPEAKGLCEKEVKAIEIKMEMLLSRIRSTKGKLIHRFFQLGL